MKIATSIPLLPNKKSLRGIFFIFIRNLFIKFTSTSKVALFFIMRKIIFLALFACLTLVTSCSVDDGTVPVEFELVPVEAVIIPAEFTLGETYTISVTYRRPTDCHAFNSFEYVAGSTTTTNIRTVAVVNLFTPGDCNTLVDNFQTQTFNFNVLDTNPYIFKFWQGKDDNNEDMYLEYEIPVN